MSSVSLDNVTKRFGAVEVIRGVDIDIRAGEFCVFVGPSGCGKSTLLRLIAGLEEITGGNVRIGDRVVNDMEPAARGTAMVFQSYALYPHMTVERNMGFGLIMNGMPKAEVKRRVDEAARILRIESLLDRKPRQLSGGQRQRVAIGRAIVRDPEVFLFDEPLSNLDAELRVATRIEIAKLHRHLGSATMIYVTHDQVEAMTLADRIVVLRDGRVEQVGTPLDIYKNPNNVFVAGFIGSPKMNLIALDVGGDGARATARLPNGESVELIGPNADKAVTLGIRPDALSPVSEGGVIKGEVTVIERLGDTDFLYVRPSWDQEITVKCAAGVTFNVGDKLGLAFAGKTHCFEAGGTSLPGVEAAPVPS